MAEVISIKLDASKEEKLITLPLNQQSQFTFDTNIPTYRRSNFKTENIVLCKMI
jgi:hypothetical protein